LAFALRLSLFHGPQDASDWNIFGREPREKVFCRRLGFAHILREFSAILGAKAWRVRPAVP
jgi:hypothetical protein